MRSNVGMAFAVQIKPLSVNEAWQGKRFKTKSYKQYERDLGFMLPKIVLPIADKYEVHYEFGFSNPLSDIDNPVKPLQDILQKKYNFDDRKIYKCTITKVIVPKGKEYIQVTIYPISEYGK